VDIERNPNRELIGKSYTDGLLASLQPKLQTDTLTGGIQWTVVGTGETVNHGSRRERLQLLPGQSASPSARPRQETTISETRLRPATSQYQRQGPQKHVTEIGLRSRKKQIEAEQSEIKQFTSWLGKRSYKARLERFGLARLQEIARANGKKGGRPKGKLQKKGGK
jgi:hypothetical protein